MTSLATADTQRGQAVVSLRTTRTGALTQVRAHGRSLLLHPASELEDGAAGWWLRRRGGPAPEPVPLSGTASTGGHVEPTEGGVCRSGRDRELSWRWALRTTEDGWTWTVVVTNHGSAEVELDLVQVQDLALADPGAVRGSALYVSQYLDVTPVDVGAGGTALAVRQNMPGERVPWALTGCLTGADRWASDLLQLTGRGLVEGAPWPGLRQELPARRLQHEHTVTALQSRPLRVAPGASVTSGFFVVLRADHPEPSGPADAALAAGALAEGVLSRPPGAVEVPGQTVGTDAPSVPAPPGRSVFAADRPGVATRALTDAELTREVGDVRHHVDEVDGTPASWFTGAGEHVVTQGKQAAVLRPHGQILRTGDRLLPDERDVTSTVWMDGSVCSQLAQGHVERGTVLSRRRSYLGLDRAHGLRLLVDDGQGWTLLGTPSLWSSGPDRATWWYARDERVLRVTAHAPPDAAGVTVQVDTVAGDPVPVLVALGLDWCGAPGQVGPVDRVDADRVRVGAPAGSDAARRDPDAALDLRWSPGALGDVRDDGALFDDGLSRGEPWVGAVVEALPAWALQLQPRLARPPVQTAAATSAPVALIDHVDFWSDLRGRLDLAAGTSTSAASAARVSALAQTVPWMTHDALVHYLSPRGLEQHTGGAWGTRDVSQGPVGLLGSLGAHDSWRALLLLVLGAQRGRGDWPQAFDFLPGHRSAEGLGEPHGDVVYWPLLAMGQYLLATDDTGLLDEPVPFADDTDGTDGAAVTVRDHLDRAVTAIEDTLIDGTALPVYGHGDWNDSLQPADPALARRMVSTWTVVLQAHALGTLAEGLGEASPTLAARCRDVADRGVADLRRHLLVDGVLAGYALREDDGTFTPLIHPRDARTGLTYSLLPLIHALSGDLFTPEEAQAHTRIVREHLSGPDGARLFDRPVAYHGGPMEVFQRAEASTFFGREIGIMYVHAHLRWAQALARLGEGAELLHALSQVNPVGLAEVVPQARPRQANTYFSSSDAAVADRADAAERYPEVVAGGIPLESGWRVYSSGPGLFLEVLTQHLLGVRAHGATVQLDPVLDPSLGSVQATVHLLGRPRRLQVVSGPRGHGPVRVRVGGVEIATTRLQNPYRTAGVEVGADDLRAALADDDVLEVELG
ncbi:GH36-type glycosyl hydrolase domain-containing protein [Serinicoccus sp. LYQ131]|uniref:GH36-type glycosyl hydrolase domain-containing protein n=1 Tax=Serinicoccus sp. LYQ131 TaxID=3378797 RepID=UPI0038534BB8